MEKRNPWTDTTALIVLGCALLLAVMIRVPRLAVPVFLLGVISYAVLVYRRMMLVKQREQQHAPPPEIAQLPPSYRERAHTLFNLQQEVLAELESPGEAEDYLREYAQPILKLGGKYVKLMHMLVDIEAYLGQVSGERLQAQQASLQSKLQACTDEQAKRSLEAAHETLQQQAQNVDELRGGAQRIDAQLTNIELSMEKFLGQIIKLRSVEARAAQLEGKAVGEELSQLNTEMDSLTQTMEELFRSDENSP